MTFMRDYVKLHTKAEMDNMMPPDGTTNEDFLNEHRYADLNISPALQPSQSSDVERRVSDLTTDHIIDLLKTRAPSKEVSPSNPHINFFNSLIPDIERLSSRRQRKFKEQVMTLLNNFLDEEENEAVATPFSKYGT